MIRWIGATTLATVLAFGLTTKAEGDTITLKSGVSIDGKVLFQDEQTVRISIGDRERIYPATTVVHFDENEKTGHFDPEAAIEEARKRLADLERKTGLTVHQRQEIETLLFAMQSTDTKIYKDAKQSILHFNQNTASLDKFLPYAMQTLEPSLIAGVLDVFGTIDPFKGARAARSHLTCPAPNGRAMALSVFGHGEAPDRIALIARGMVDPSPEVRIAAARSLGELNARKATPLLIDATGSGTPRLIVVANTALTKIWKTELKTQAEWKAFWEKTRPSVFAPLVRIAMLPLVHEDDVYTSEE